MSNTALFGEKKFGTFKFGPTTQTRPRFGFEVDWNNKALFTGENEAKYIYDLTIERGRKYLIKSDGTAFEEQETGKVSAVLLDQERRFDPYNEASPLYGKMGGGKYFRITVRTPSDNYYPLMAGMIDEPVNFEENGISKARLEGTDGWGFLRNLNDLMTIPLQENVYPNEIINQILDASRYPKIWGRSLDTGIDQRPFFWADGRSPAKTIHETAQNELGNVFIAADGKLTFKSRVTPEINEITLTDDDVMRNGITRMQPSDVIRNLLKVETSPRSSASVQTVWEIPGRLQISPGQTYDDVFAEFQYNNQTTPVKDPINPVSGTDFDATEFEDGSGADYTSDVIITMYAYSTRAQLSITNNGSNVVWVYVKVRGTPIVKGSSVSFEYEDVESIKQFGPRTFVFSIDQNVNVARQYRDLLALYLTSAKDYLVADLVPNPDVQFALDLGMIVRGQFNRFGIDESYRVIRLRHKFSDKAGIVTWTRVWLEPYIRLFAGVQIPVQVPFQLGGS